MKPKGKCFCKTCEDCHWFFQWDMTNQEGLRKSENRCLFQVLAEEIPHIRGSIDGVQKAANEARNRAEETKGAVSSFGFACQSVLRGIGETLSRRKRLN